MIFTPSSKTRHPRRRQQKPFPLSFLCSGRRAFWSVHQAYLLQVWQSTLVRLALYYFCIITDQQTFKPKFSFTSASSKFYFCIKASAFQQMRVKESTSIQFQKNNFRFLSPRDNAVLEAVPKGRIEAWGRARLWSQPGFTSRHYHY